MGYMKKAMNNHCILKYLIIRWKDTAMSFKKIATE